MSYPHQNDNRTLELAKIAGTEEDIALLQEHVKEVIEGAAFKGSHRSGQFLKYIVEQAIAGHFESLKERVIGVELFGRSPSYDTGEDAIVRVTASDVRKRLLQHYGRYGTTSEFRISLPLGSYIPEITRDLHYHEPVLVPVNAATVHVEEPPATLSAPTTPLEAVTTPVPIEPHIAQEKHVRTWPFVSTLIGLLLLGLLGALWNRSHISNSAATILPWTDFLTTPRALQLIASDPDIAEIQDYTRQPVSVSDYANHKYIPEPDKLSPDILRLSQGLMRGDKASIVDLPIAVSIAELAQIRSKKIEVHFARTVQLANLQTDDNFILLGSPRSNPWTAFFSDPLSFHFVYDQNMRQEIIRNVHPRPNEQAQYVPTGLGWATGQSYAIVALVRNPDQNGQVLILAGANAEGTEAAGKLVIDLPRMSAALKNCGISPTGPMQHFEMLLKLSMMAGSSTSVNVEACHILPPKTQ